MIFLSKRNFFFHFLRAENNTLRLFLLTKVSENDPPGTATALTENKESKGFKLPNDVIAYFDAIIYNSNRLSRNVMCFYRFTQNKSRRVDVTFCLSINDFKGPS